ncbi:MAG: acylphosphatase [ANME-2 cluster archaeon]|jgi:acylphosphatase|nr:acylphosphatase [ANME-2 cluster archaeon]
METRAGIIIHGRIQKAGYRDFIDEAAFNLDLTGQVKNLDDGTVQVICEGETDNIKKLLEIVNISQYPIRVEKIDVRYSEPTGDFKIFEIIREEDLTTATYERMDTAVRYMREMNTNLGQKIDGVGDKIDGVSDKIDDLGKNLSDKIDGVGGKIDKLDENLGNKIDSLGGKIDLNREEISHEIRIMRGELTSYFDERISRMEHELAEIRVKVSVLE